MVTAEDTEHTHSSFVCQRHRHMMEKLLYIEICTAQICNCLVFYNLIAVFMDPDGPQCHRSLGTYNCLR